MGNYLIGIDLGGTNVNVGVVDRSGKVITKHALPLGKAQTRQDVLDAIYRTTDETLERAGMKLEKVSALGVATPGTLDIERGVVIVASNLPDWRDVALREVLKERFNVG